MQSKVDIKADQKILFLFMYGSGSTDVKSWVKILNINKNKHINLIHLHFFSNIQIFKETLWIIKCIYGLVQDRGKKTHQWIVFCVLQYQQVNVYQI